MANIFPTINHLQILFDVAEYENILEKNQRGGSFNRWNLGTKYWDNIPTYLISRCPFCGATYTGKLDTHSLAAGWFPNPDKWDSVGLPERERINCQHFVAVQTFINLQGSIPNDSFWHVIDLDVPFIMPPFVPDDIPSIAVIHSLPICDIEQHQFVPRYAAYMITYYSEDPKRILERRHDNNALMYKFDPDAHATMLFTSSEANEYPESWNLELWVRRGKLQWLDPATPDLQLRAGPPEALPYKLIRGYRQPMLVENGKIRRW